MSASRGQERLLYKSFPINVVFVRGSYADEYGNCTVHHEIGPIDVTAMAQACRNSGGKVIVQVEKIVQGGSLDPKLVAIPGIYVDSIVVGSIEDNEQCLGMPYDGSLTEVPDVSGKSADFARQMLAAAGLNCVVEGDANGVVQSQSSEVGASVQRGTIVTIACG